jgi:hypothetical protein
VQKRADAATDTGVSAEEPIRRIFLQFFFLFGEGVGRLQYRSLAAAVLEARYGLPSRSVRLSVIISANTFNDDWRLQNIRRKAEKVGFVWCLSATKYNRDEVEGVVRMGMVKFGIWRTVTSTGSISPGIE